MWSAQSPSRSGRKALASWRPNKGFYCLSGRNHAIIALVPGWVPLDDLPKYHMLGVLVAGDGSGRLAGLRR